MHSIETACHIVKIGTGMLVGADNRPCPERMNAFVWELVHARKQLKQFGRDEKILVVSSGAIAHGRAALDLDPSDPRYDMKQALSAAGQVRLMQSYNQALESYGVHAGQVLLTGNQLTREWEIGHPEHTKHGVNAVINSLRQQFELGILPVINANDSTSYEELYGSDNDKMAVLIARFLKEHGMHVRTVNFLTESGGVYSGDPKLPTSRLLTSANQISSELIEVIQGHCSANGRGGIGSKIEQAHQASQIGAQTLISSHRVNRGIVAEFIVHAECIEKGTFFPAKPA